MFVEKLVCLQYLPSIFRLTQKLATLTMTNYRKMLAFSTQSSSLQVHSTDAVYFQTPVAACEIHLLKFFSPRNKLLFS